MVDPTALSDDNVEEIHAVYRAIIRRDCAPGPMSLRSRSDS
jgi:hypothetical protein